MSYELGYIIYSDMIAVLFYVTDQTVFLLVLRGPFDRIDTYIDTI